MQPKTIINRCLNDRARQLDLTQIDLTELLPANTIMVVSVTATTSSGQALAPDAFAKVVEVCCCVGGVVVQFSPFCFGIVLGDGVAIVVVGV
jgi:hypothetical protein